MFMAYSKKLNDILSFYATILGDNYFTYSTDWNKNLEGCKWAENNGLDFQGKKFRLEDYVQNMPIYDQNYKPTGEYQKIVTPDLPLLVIQQNYKDPQMNIILPQGIIAYLIKSSLGMLARTKVADILTVYRKDIVQYNQELNDFAYKYATDTNPLTVPFIVREGGIYRLSNDAYITEDKSAEMKKSPVPSESLLTEEEIIKRNLVGLLSVISDLLGDGSQQYLVPKDPLDIN